MNGDGAGTAGTAGLFERESHIRELADAVAGLASGTGGLVVVEGAAGIGKTVLLADAVGWPNTSA